MAQKPYKRRLEFVAGSSNKFWEAEVVGDTLITRWGRNGTAGQAKVETVAYGLAMKEADNRTAKKIRAGYIEVFGSWSVWWPRQQLNVRPMPEAIPLVLPPVALRRQRIKVQTPIAAEQEAAGSLLLPKRSVKI